MSFCVLWDPDTHPPYVFLSGRSSTRTRTTFEIAAKHLGADVINLNVERSSASKGETLLDTISNLEAMHADLFVIRDSSAGAAYLVAKHVDEHVSVLNAGDGRHAHPTQAMLDMFTIREYKKDFKNLSVIKTCPFSRPKKWTNCKNDNHCDAEKYWNH